MLKIVNRNKETGEVVKKLSHRGETLEYITTLGNKVTGRFTRKSEADKHINAVPKVMESK